MIISMPTLARRALKVFVFLLISFSVGRLSSPYYYNVININSANAISDFIYGNVYAEDVDDVYFYINFIITILLSLFVYFCLAKVMVIILNKWRE